QEIGVFTLRLSDLIVFDENLYMKRIPEILDKKKYNDPYSAIIYDSTHYTCLLEWVYLEKYLLDVYNRVLSQTISQHQNTPEDMLRIQKQTMQYLVNYKPGITPFPSREDFLEKARSAHRIYELQEKFEKKRDLVIDYVIQQYTLRTNKSIQLVNIFISATAAFSLMQVILEIWQDSAGLSKLFWFCMTAILFIAILAILWGLNQSTMKFANRNSK
ncbi:MAG: hypothetical protein NZ108_08895, partial [Bacteroidia bacterium]|nr:hypothetical protein [Bacteroidia bacterium]